MSKLNHLITAIENALPQTQCGLCEYSGCKPYAEAIAYNNESIDRCLPGGIRTLRALGIITQQNSTPFETEMTKKAKPAMLAVIREAECIGCTKCIQACPVDAIIGASKEMHTVIADVCTGCELCIEPCPVDCIDLIEIAERDEQTQQTFAQALKKRYEVRNKRIAKEALLNAKQHKAAKLEQSEQNTVDARKAYIQAALQRVNAKKGTFHE